MSPTVVAAGTPEDIVLNPATDYVAEFTRNVSKARVVRAGSVMRPANERTRQVNGVAVPVRATVAEAAPLFGEAVETLRVIGTDGTTVGMLDRSDVVDLMMRG